jgi:dihydropyrimidinase
MPRTLVTGGTVVSADGAERQDVLIEGETIAALGAPGPTGPAASWAEGADLIVDATGKYVIPGGIDSHTHMDMPFGGTHSADTFETGTRAAAWGGTTMLIDFAIQSKGDSLAAGMDTWRKKADGTCAIDYSFHAIIADVTPSALDEMDALVDEGITSFKLFMAYPGVFYATDKDIYKAMDRASSNGALIMMHAENGIAIDAIVEGALLRGETAPIYHGRTRPPELEGEAASRAIRLAQVTKAPLYIVHLSSKPALDAVVEARSRGQNTFAETCPQYLFLSEEDMDRPGFEGAKFVCTPPLRPREHQAVLWRGLRTDQLSVVSTDHCPFCFAEQKELGLGDFTKIPNGLPGVENRMDLIYQGVVAGEITLSRWVEVTSTTPAKMFGLYPRKGTIAPGSDADIVVYDPAATQTISAATHHMAVDYSCYEGMSITGRVDRVFSRGRQIIAEGAYLGSPGDGRFVKRALCQNLA